MHLVASYLHAGQLAAVVPAGIPVDTCVTVRDALGRRIPRLHTGTAVPPALPAVDGIDGLNWAEPTLLLAGVVARVGLAHRRMRDASPTR